MLEWCSWGWPQRIEIDAFTEPQFIPNDIYHLRGISFHARQIFLEAFWWENSSNTRLFPWFQFALIKLLRRRPDKYLDKLQAKVYFAQKKFLL